MKKKPDIFDLIGTLLSKIDLPIRIVDPNGIIVWMNELQPALLQINPVTILGSKQSQVFSEMHSQVSTTLQAESLLLMTHLQSMEIETKAGEEAIHIRETVYPFEFEESEKFVAVIVEDLTPMKKLESALQEDRFHRKALLANLPLIFYVIDAQGIFLLSEGAGLKSLGLKAGEVVGVNVFDMYRDNPEISNTVREAIVGNVSHNIDLVGDLYFETWFTPIHDEGGNVTQLMAVSIDITPKISAEKLLHEEESRMRAILETSKDWIWAINTNGVHTYSNPAVKQILGYEAQEIVGGQSIELLHPDDQKRVTERLPHWISSKEGWNSLITRWRHKDGSYRTLESNSVPILDEQKELIGFRGVDRDITTRIEAEQALKGSEHRFKMLAEASLEGIVIASNKKFTDANQQFLDMVGYTREELENRPMIDLVAPESRDKLKRLQAQPPNTPYELIVQRKDGKTFPILGQTRELEYQGELVRISAVRDMSFFQKIENEIIQTNLELTNALSELKELKEKVVAENVLLREEVRHVHIHKDIVGQSDSMKSVLVQAEQVANTDSTVLILGETGTGKELLARAIHEMSDRKDKSLIIVNCAAMPSTLVESELFGREKGAFTGALTRQIGRFEIADGATIFLDEIGELPLETQSKLLRVLQEGQFERLGSSKTIKVDVRIIAATNRDLNQEILEKRFREDLFYRLNVFPLEIPPLRHRLDDIQPLVWSFIDQFADKMGKRIKKISASSVTRLQQYSWPGNIRELRNVIERAMIKSMSTTLNIEVPGYVEEPFKSYKKLDDVEREHILSVLEETHWIVSGPNGAALILDMKPTTLISRMKKLGIERSK